MRCGYSNNKYTLNIRKVRKEYKATRLRVKDFLSADIECIIGGVTI
jgi:hypothetical protein